MKTLFYLGNKYIENSRTQLFTSVHRIVVRKERENSQEKRQVSFLECSKCLKGLALDFLFCFECLLLV